MVLSTIIDVPFHAKAFIAKGVSELPNDGILSFELERRLDQNGQQSHFDSSPSLVVGSAGPHLKLTCLLV